MYVLFCTYQKHLWRNLHHLDNKPCSHVFSKNRVPVYPLVLEMVGKDLKSGYIGTYFPKHKDMDGMDNSASFLNI